MAPLGAIGNGFDKEAQDAARELKKTFVTYGAGTYMYNTAQLCICVCVCVCMSVYVIKRLKMPLGN